MFLVNGNFVYVKRGSETFILVYYNVARDEFCKQPGNHL
jgi:hypothetical protein